MQNKQQPMLLVLGSLNLDLVLDVPRMPDSGETLASDRSATFCGGKGANQAVACARMGANVAMLGRVGADPSGQMLLGALVGEGVAVDGVLETAGHSSGIAVIMLTPDGQNRILLAAGANGQLSANDVTDHAAAIEGAAMLVCQLEVPLETVEAGIAIAAARGVPVLLNPAPARALSDSLLARVDYLVPNETEAAELTGIAVIDDASAEAAAKALLDRGVRCVVLTRGAAGITLADANGFRHMAALPADAVDTTAAGDSFIGGFATGFIEGLDVDAAAQLGLKVAQLCVGREGAQASLPRRAEL